MNRQHRKTRFVNTARLLASSLLDINVDLHGHVNFRELSVDSPWRSLSSLMVAKEVEGVVEEERGTRARTLNLSRSFWNASEWIPRMWNCPTARNPLKIAHCWATWVSGDVVVFFDNSINKICNGIGEIHNVQLYQGC